MRGVVALLMLAALTACGASHPKDPGADVTRADRVCRDRFASLGGTEGENGNPAPPRSPLVARYEAEKDAVYKLSLEARGDDCPGTLARHRRLFDALHELSSAASDADMADALAMAERDLEHARRTRDMTPMPTDLAQAFAELRAHAGPARADLRPAINATGDVDLADRDDVAAAVRGIRQAADGSSEVALCRAALDVIADHELSEE
jgi:hypothetical protein